MAKVFTGGGDGIGYDVKQAQINYATQTTPGAIVAAVTGKKIRVLSMQLVTAGAVTVTWKSATDTICAAQSFAANAVFSANFGPQGYLFETAASAALNIVLGGAVQVSGTLNYIEV
jgi:hypothetical protein